MATVRKIEVRFPAEEVERMMALVNQARLPSQLPFNGAEGWGFGMDLSWLKKVKEQWVREWSHDAFEARLNRWPHYLARLENGQDVHFIHARSERPDAKPLLLIHGWPGTFNDFHKMIDPLIKPGNPDMPAFHVVVPSIPGYGLSSFPTDEPLTYAAIAKLFHRLMHKILGYDEYVVHGGDLGANTIRLMYSDPEISKHVRLAHLNAYFYYRKREVFKLLLGNFWPGPLLSYIPGYDSLCSFLESLEYTPAERAILGRTFKLASPHENRLAYAMLHRTRPLTIGYALNDHPAGLLSYIGEKFFAWSGGEDGVNVDGLIGDLIDNVAIYHLTKSFHTSVLVYNMTGPEVPLLFMQHEKFKVAHETKIGYSLMPYEMGGATRSTFNRIGKLVFYNEHTSGGHFASLDNPTGLVKDLRQLAAHWD